jgi:hypothetical protein
MLCLEPRCPLNGAAHGYARIVEDVQLVIDARYATHVIDLPEIVRSIAQKLKCMAIPE